MMDLSPSFLMKILLHRLTESSKSPASIVQSNKQGTCLYQEWCKPLLISCKAAFGYEQVAKRIANIRLNKVRQAEENSICEKSMLTQEVLR